MLSRDDQRRISQAFAELAESHDSTFETTADRREPTAQLRWSDVPLAVPHACDEVEMAVVRAITHEDGLGYEYQLRTIEGWPATLVIRKLDAAGQGNDGRSIYAARATVGHFANRAPCTARAQALLDALDNQMCAFGRKRRFDSR